MLIHSIFDLLCEIYIRNRHCLWKHLIFDQLCHQFDVEKAIPEIHENLLKIQNYNLKVHNKLIQKIFLIFFYQFKSYQ